MWRPSMTLGGLLALICGVVLPIVGATPAAAATTTVTSTADGGPGSLRLAVATTALGGTITFASTLNTRAIELTSGQILLNKPVTLRGNGVGQTIVRRAAGTPDFRVFRITGIQVTVDGMTIAGGAVADSGGGVLIDNVQATISRSLVAGNRAGLRGGGLAIEQPLVSASITNSVIENNRAGAGGGGVSAAGPLLMTDSIVRLNTVSSAGSAEGGGILADGDRLDLRNVDIAQNRAEATAPFAQASAGGIAVRSPIVSIAETSVRLNTADGGGFPLTSLFGGGMVIGAVQGQQGTVHGLEVSENTLTGGSEAYGGGVYFENAGVYIFNSTIANNSAGAELGVGGAFAAATSEVFLDSITLAGNTAELGSNVANFGARINVRRTIFASSSPGEMCAGTIEDGGDNLSFGGTIGTCPGTVADPVLRALAYNGGPTRTMALGTGSAAIDAIDAGTACPTIDQRRYPRVGTCDIGAYEAASTSGDTAPPACTITGMRADNPKQTDITVSDTSSGVQSVSVLLQLLQLNAVVNVPYFQPGTVNNIVLTVTTVNQLLPSVWGFTVTDYAGNTAVCI